VADDWIDVSESDDLETARHEFLSWLHSHDLSESDLAHTDVVIQQMHMRSEGRHWHPLPIQG